jgi:hypothetical protein
MLAEAVTRRQLTMRRSSEDKDGEALGSLDRAAIRPG